MNVLVTGCAGFIGSHVVERLLAEGHYVVGVDSFDPFYPSEIKRRNLSVVTSNSNFRMLILNINDQNFSKKVPKGIDVIIHLAAKAGVRPSIADPLGYQQTNVAGTQAMLEFARERGIKQFVFASSSSVYGVNPRVPWSESDAVLLPISPYASTKVSGELLGHVYSHLYGIRFIALRFFTIYGPRQRPDLAIHKFSRQILKGEPITLFGDGTTRRDYTYIDDTIDGVVAALHYSGSQYDVINLSNETTVTLAELVLKLQLFLNRDAEIKYLPEQPGDVPQTWGDISKARQLLGYKPRMNFDQGLQKFVAWLKEQSL